MLNQIKSLLNRNKYITIGVPAVLAATAVIIIVLNLSYQKSQQPLTSAPTPTVPATTTPTSAVDASAEPSATAPSSAAPTQKPGTSGAFALTICPADVKLNPKVNAASSFTPVEQPARQPLADIRLISTGHIFDEAGYGSQFGSSFALANDGTLYQWGIVNWDAKNRPSAFPQKVTGISGTIQQIDGRFVLTEEGDVFLLYSGSAPQKIKELSGSTAIAQAREAEVYAIDSEGNVRYYTLYGPKDAKPYFAKLTALGLVKSVKASPFILLAITKDGQLLKLDPYAAPGTKPETVAVADEFVTDLYPTMSYKYLAYLKTNQGHWFTITNEQKVEHAKVPADTVQIAAMEHDIAALKADGTVWAWGEGGNVLPQEGIVTPEKARQIQGFANVKSIAAGQSHLLALTEDGRILSAGSNMYGQLGWKAIYAEQPTAIGVWQGLDGMFPIYSQLFAVTHGDIWSLDANLNVKPVLLDQKAKKAFTALGHYAILTESGKLIIADPDETQPCRILQTPSPIVDAASTTNGLVLALQDGRVYKAEGNMRMIEVKAEMRMSPKPAGKVTQVFGDPIPFVLTDEGEVYFQQEMQGSIPILKPVSADTPIKQWASLHYDFFEGNGFVGKALGVNHRVYEVNLRINGDRNAENQTAAIELKATQQTGIALSGGAVIEEGGRITEKLYNANFDTKLPSGVNLRAEASQYHVPMEGRIYIYHYFAAEDGTIYWLGDIPFDGPMTAPKTALAP